MIAARVMRLLGSRSVVSGAILYVGMRWFDRLVGVVSTVVLARLLTPDDFGVVALASIALNLAIVMLDFGIGIAVVQRANLDRDDIDTAWTLRLIQNTLVAALLSVSAAWVVRYYGDVRLGPVLHLLALGYLLEGLVGMGPIVFQKRQQYAYEVAYVMSRRLGGFVVTIALALWLRSYWALVFGSVLTSGLGVVLSHAMYRVMPRLTIRRWRSLVGASFWVLVRSIGGFAGGQLDKIVIGRRDGAATLGAYTLADQIAAMPTSELLAPMSRALFPALVAIQNDVERLRRAYLYALGIQCMFALPASIGLALIAKEVVSVMLGEKWVSAVPIMVAMALAYGATSITHSGNYLMLSLGKFRAQALVAWGLFAALALLVLVVYPESGAAQIAWFRVVIAGGSIVAVSWLAIQYLPGITPSDLLAMVVRPALATLAMAVMVAWTVSLVAAQPAWLRLTSEVLVGASAYTMTLGALWLMAGRPEGAEQWMLERLRSFSRVVRNS